MPVVVGYSSSAMAHIPLHRLAQKSPLFAPNLSLLLCTSGGGPPARHAALPRPPFPFGIFLALIHTSIVGIGNFSSYTWVVWKKGRCLACASSNWVGVSPRVTCTVRTISFSSLRGRGVAHVVVVILIIKTFIQDRAKLCLPQNIIACFSTSHRARKEKGSQEKEWQLVK